ncbi:MAG: hypothetical protein GC192_20990 [Bacteroidetes bacterium]|nr:hypothetical protein [Bacteroidota bacterium]
MPASTIVETMAAMLVVVVSLGIGMMIFSNVLNAELVVARAKAQTVLARLADEAISQELFISESLEVEGMLIEKDVSAYHADYPGAALLTLTAYTPGKTKVLCEQKQIVYPSSSW